MLRSVNRSKTGNAEAEHRVVEAEGERFGIRGVTAVKAEEGGDTAVPSQWDRGAILNQVMLVVIFVALFLLTDGASTSSQAWEGAPPCYLWVRWSMALLLCGGKRYYPVVFFASVVAAMVNYHRPLVS